MAAPFYPPYVNILTALGMVPVILEANGTGSTLNVPALSGFAESGGHEGAQLSERVSGCELLDRAPKRAPAGDAGAEDRRLCERGAVVDAQERILAHDLNSELQEVGTYLRDLVAHI